MDEIYQLEYLSLVSKVCTELDNHLGINDKDLAEFVIHLAEKHDSFDSYKKALAENGAVFSDSFIANLLRLIQKMRPKSNEQKIDKFDSAEIKTDKELQRQLLPALAIPNDPKIRTMLDDEKREKEPEPGDNIVADDMMKQLELLFDPHKSKLSNLLQYKLR